MCFWVVNVSPPLSLSPRGLILHQCCADYSITLPSNAHRLRSAGRKRREERECNLSKEEKGRKATRMSTPVRSVWRHSFGICLFASCSLLNLKKCSFLHSYVIICWTTEYQYLAVPVIICAIKDTDTWHSVFLFLTLQDIICCATNFLLPSN